MKKLSDHQRKTLDALHPINTDIDVAVVYTRVYGDPGSQSARTMQQKLAPTFSAINEKLVSRKVKIEPGETKRTYRFSTKQEG